MAKFDYVKAQKLAFDLIDKFGQQTPIVRVFSDYDEVEGTRTITGYYLTIGTVVSLPATNGRIQAFDNRKREDLKQGKLRFFYVAAKDLAFEPVANDFFFFEGCVWDMQGATPLDPAGTRIMFSAGCKQGDKNHLGDLLAALASATDDNWEPLEVNDPDVLQEMILRIEALEATGVLDFSQLPSIC